MMGSQLKVKLKLALHSTAKREDPCCVHLSACEKVFLSCAKKTFTALTRSICACKNVHHTMLIKKTKKTQNQSIKQHCIHAVDAS